MNTHSNETPYMCETCGAKYFTRHGLRAHKCGQAKKPRKPRDSRYCAPCDSRFLTLEEKRKHECPYKHPDDPKLVNCRLCERSIRRKEFPYHIEYFHSGKSFVCPVCDIPLQSEKSLKSKSVTINTFKSLILILLYYTLQSTWVHMTALDYILVSIALKGSGQRSTLFATCVVTELQKERSTATNASRNSQLRRY